MNNNKLAALAFMVVNGLAMTITKDGTMFVFSLMIGIPLFFSKKNWIN